MTVVTVDQELVREDSKMESIIINYIVNLKTTNLDEANKVAESLNLI